jgi:hypothetical protein
LVGWTFNQAKQKGKANVTYNSHKVRRRRIRRNRSGSEEKQINKNMYAINQTSN